MEIELLRLRLKGAKIAGNCSVSEIIIHGRGENLSIGEFSCVGRIYMQAHVAIKIGSCVVINDGVKIITGSHDIHCANYHHKFAGISVSDYAWIAMDAMLLQGVSIGYGAVVGAGSVVTKDVAAFEVVVGNPARKVGMRRDVDFKYRPALAYASANAWIGSPYN